MKKARYQEGASFENTVLAAMSSPLYAEVFNSCLDDIFQNVPFEATGMINAWACGAGDHRANTSMRLHASVLTGWSMATAVVFSTQ